MKLIDIIFETVVDMEEAGKPISRNEFIQRSNKIHNGKYTYDNVNYVGSKIPVMITCPKHGDFPVTQNNHLNGVGCKKCYNERNKSNSSDFIKKSQIVHQNPDGTPKYTYDKVDYKDWLMNQKRLPTPGSVEYDAFYAFHEELCKNGCMMGDTYINTFL